jgi:uncharacterized repeat protein (TIGR02543 family)
VYAQWERIGERVKITFDENGAEVKAAPQERAANIGDFVILPEEPVWNGWVFKEWNTQADGAGDKFDATTPVTEDKRVFAVWEIAPDLSYTVTFNANGGTISRPEDESRTVTPPAICVTTMPADPDPEPEHAGKVFVGWYTEKTGGDLFTRISLVEDNMTVYAQWEDRASDEARVYFDGNGGTGHQPVHFTVKKGGELGSLPTDPGLDGYAFDGWYTEHTGGDPVTASMPIDEDRVFYARWKPETGTSSDNVTVTFDPNLRYGLRLGSNWGGNPVKTVNVNPGATLADPGDPSHKFHIFDGWYTAPTGGTAVSFPQPINEDKIFYAQWTFLLTSAGEVDEYLNFGDYYNNEDGTLEDPVNLPGKIDFGPMTQAGSDWRQVLGALFGAAVEYVDLDLSKSTVNGNEFNPIYNDTTGKDKIVSLTLPDTVTKITDAEEYYYPSFENLRIVSGKGVTYVGEFAFDACSFLEEIDLPKTRTIGGNAFQFTGLKNVVMPEAETIGGGAFDSCTELESISLPNAETIGGSAFANCTELESISLPEAVTIVGSAVYYCTGLPSVSLPKAVTIGGFAFYGCTELKNVSLPNAVTIEYGAFADCTALPSVSLPKAVTIEYYAFGRCTELKSISMPKAETIGTYAFQYCTELKDVSLPNAVTFDGEAFQYCTELESISLPNAVTIGNNTFSSCTKLKNVSLPNAEKIGNDAFAYCPVQSIILPKAKTIGAMAFYGCTVLETVIIPMIESFGTYVFANNGTQALTITMGPVAPAVGVGSYSGSYTFQGITEPKTVYVKIPQEATGYLRNDDIPPYTVGGTGEQWGYTFRGGYSLTHITVIIDYQ